MEFYDMSWYRMPATYQKQVLCAIHSAQNGAMLTMGPLGELDFAMAATVSENFDSSLFRMKLLGLPKGILSFLIINGVDGSFA